MYQKSKKALGPRDTPRLCVFSMSPMRCPSFSPRVELSASYLSTDSPNDPVQLATDPPSRKPRTRDALRTRCATLCKIMLGQSSEAHIECLPLFDLGPYLLCVVRRFSKQTPRALVLRISTIETWVQSFILILYT
jgi:hypothetical protein